MISLRLYSLILTSCLALLIIYFFLRRKPKTPEELERERREWLDRVGRITDGTVIDVQEMTVDGSKKSTPRSATLLIYHYYVAGGLYEALQDVNHLRQWVKLQA